MVVKQINETIWRLFNKKEKVKRKKKKRVIIFTWEVVGGCTLQAFSRTLKLHILFGQLETLVLLMFLSNTEWVVEKSTLFHQVNKTKIVVSFLQHTIPNFTYPANNQRNAVACLTSKQTHSKKKSNVHPISVFLSQ